VGRALGLPMEHGWQDVMPEVHVPNVPRGGARAPRVLELGLGRLMRGVIGRNQKVIIRARSRETDEGRNRTQSEGHQSHQSEPSELDLGRLRVVGTR
jgi:hypothetical protein